MNDDKELQAIDNVIDAAQRSNDASGSVLTEMVDKHPEFTSHQNQLLNLAVARRPQIRPYEKLIMEGRKGSWKLRKESEEVNEATRTLTAEEVKKRYG